MPTPRPRTVTLASIYAGVGGLVMLVTFLDLATNWGSLEVQRSLEGALESTPLGQSMDIDTLLPMVRTTAIVGAFLAILVIVFAIFVSRGDRTSRMGLTVLAAAGLLLFLASGIAGMLSAVLAALVLGMLWSQPSREWFKAVNSTEPLALADSNPFVAPPTPAQQNVGEEQKLNGPNEAVDEEKSALLRPDEYFSSPAGDAPAQMPAAPMTPPPGPAYASELSIRPDMPSALKIALAVMGVCAAVVSGVSVLVLLAVTVMRDEMTKELATNPDIQRQLDTLNMSLGDVMSLMIVLMSAILAVCVFALVAVGLAFTRKRFAWWLLVVACLFGLGFSVLSIPVGLISAIPIAYVMVILFRTDSRQAFM